MYKYKIIKQKDNQFIVENLVSHKSSIMSEDKVKLFAKDELLTNVILKNDELFRVKDALETYEALRDQIWDVASLKALVSEKDSKKGVIYCIRIFDGYGEDITQLVYDFLYSELGLGLDEKGNILYLTPSVDPLWLIKKAINIKCYKVQENLVPEKAEMVSIISEYRISKAMKEIIRDWDC